MKVREYIKEKARQIDPNVVVMLLGTACIGVGMIALLIKACKVDPKLFNLVTNVFKNSEGHLIIEFAAGPPLLIGKDFLESLPLSAN